MNLPQIITLICWVIFLIYWFINCGHIKPSQETQSQTKNFRGLGLEILAILLLDCLVFHNALQFPLCQMDITGCRYHNLMLAFPALLIEILGAVWAVLGLVVAIIARTLWLITGAPHLI